MNIFRKKASLAFWFFDAIPKRTFVGLRSEVSNKLKTYDDPKKYYEELLKEVPINDKGMFTLQSYHLIRMVEKCQTAEDINTTVSAYYNFIGHKTTFTNSQIDELVLKAIKCGNPQAIHDIIFNHNYLMYYPHPNVLSELIKYYRENKQIEDAKKFLEAAMVRNLLKFSPEFFEQIIYLANDADDCLLAFSAYNHCTRLNLQVSREAFKSLIECLYKSGSVKGASKIIEAINGNNANIEDWLKLSVSQVNYPENAIRVFEKLTETELDLGGRAYIFENTEANREYFTKIYQIMEGKRSLYKRFSTALKTIKDKYPAKAIEGDLQTLIDGADTSIKNSLKSAPKEKKNKTEETNAEEKSGEETNKSA